MARAKRNRTASRTPARDRLVAALRRKGGEVRQAEACRLAGVSSSTAARAAAAGAVIRIKKGRAVYLTVPVQAAAVTVRAAALTRWRAFWPAAARLPASAPPISCCGSDGDGTARCNGAPCRAMMHSEPRHSRRTATPSRR